MGGGFFCSRQWGNRKSHPNSQKSNYTQKSTLEQLFSLVCCMQEQKIFTVVYVVASEPNQVSVTFAVRNAGHLPSEEC